MESTMLAVLLVVVLVVVLYHVVRVAVHHGIRDADRSRAREARLPDDGALERAVRRSRESVRDPREH